MTVKRTGIWPGVIRDYAEGRRLSGEGWIVCQHTGVWQPPTDVYENDDGVVVRVEVAGMRDEDFSISLAERRLVIAGTRVDPAPKRAYHQMEIRFGEFRVEVYLPWPVKPEGVEASYEKGFLEVRLPRPSVQPVLVVEAERKED